MTAKTEAEKCAEVRAMLRGVQDCNRAIVVYPCGTESGCKWYGMSPEQAAIMLYHVADELIRQRVPLSQDKQAN